MPTYPPHVLESPVRSCECPRTQHYHGTRQAYKTCLCRCDRCTEADRAYHRSRQRDGRERGRLVDAAEARQVIGVLRDAGMPFTVIAARSGVDTSTIRNVMNGHAKSLRASTLDLLRQVAPEAAPTQSNRVPAAGTRRRLRHLSLMGWPMETVAEYAGVHDCPLKSIRAGKRPEVTKTTAEGVVRATKILSRRTPPDNHSTAVTRAYAARKGWVSMFAYDDIDDPTEVPNVTPLVAPSKYSTPVEEKLDELEYLIDAGTPVGDALRRVGYASFDSVEKVARRHRPALVARLQRLNRGEAA